MQELRNTGNGYPVFIVTDQLKPRDPDVCPIGDKVTLVRSTGSFYGLEKARLYRLIDYGRIIIYLDADTTVRTDLSPLVRPIEAGFDLVICPSQQQGGDVFWHIDPDEIDRTKELLGYNPMQLQAGVFAFRCNQRIVDLFYKWDESIRQFNSQKDQAALHRALNSVPVKIHFMGHPWNGGAAINHKFGLFARSSDLRGFDEI